MMIIRNRESFSADWFVVVAFMIFLLPGFAFAELSGDWSVNSSAPASGCHYSGTATINQNESILTANATISFLGSGCPPPTALSFAMTRVTTKSLTRVTTKNFIADDLSGNWSVLSTAPVMGCSFSGTTTLIQNGPLLKGLLDLTFGGIGCPSSITLPVHFTLSSSLER